MGFERRHAGEAFGREDLAVALARDHHMEVAQAREVLRRAEQAAAEDPAGRPVRQWFAQLAEAQANARPVQVGKHTQSAPSGERAARGRAGRTGGSLVPGRQTLVMQEALDEEPEPAPARPRRASTQLGVLEQWRMSQAFGFDFNGVSIRRDSPLATGATRALVQDGEVHFREGAYQPGTREGDWLIAHELAHVVQQQGGRGERVGSRRELEREADRAATLAVQGRPAPIALRAQPGVAYAFSDSEEHAAELDEAAAIGADEAATVGGDAAAAMGSTDAAARSGGDAATTRSVEAAAMGSTDAAAARGSDAAATRGGDATAPRGSEAAATRSTDAVAVGDAGAGAEVAADGGEVADRAPGAGGDGGAPAKQEKPAPNVAGGKPEAGLRQLQGVRPDKLVPALGQLHAAATADVGKERAEQRANPPKQLSSGEAAAPRQAGEAAAPKQAGVAGSTAGAEAGAAAGASGAPGAKNASPGAEQVDAPVKAEVPGGEAAKQAKQDAATQQQHQASQLSSEIARSIASWLSSWFGGIAGAQQQDGMSEAETQRLSSSLDQLPASAAGISTEPGPAPALALQGEAKTSAAAERTRLEARTAQLEQQGRADSRVPLGEDHIETSVPVAELTAKPVSSGAPPEAALPTLSGAAPSEEIGIVAQEQHGAAIDAALAQARTDVTAERAKHARAEVQARADADTQLRDLKAKADADQAAARAQAKAEVDQARGEWQAELDRKGTAARRQADQKVAEGMAQVAAEEAKANAEARQHIEEGQRKADAEKQKGEREAAAAKQQGKRKSSGFRGWLKSKAKAFVAGMKKAVSAAISAARRAVKAVIAAAKKLAMAAIELARRAITAAIRAIGDALLAIGNTLLAAFPELKAKYQAAIRRLVATATAAVDRAAERLKQTVQAALDRLGAALDRALGLLEQGLHAIIDTAGAVVQGAIDAAGAVVDALGTWARLIKDVASGPVAWLGKLGAAVVDGIQNHLWAALQTATLEWFKSKVFELLGVTGAILQILAEGGISQDDIIQMALDSLIVAIPAALIAILVEKLVAMIVPAAGAVMAIIEGLQAAWGTISRIIAAFAAFMAFLLAVRSGAAGPLFATALAAGAVVLLDFVANWLLAKLRGAARTVGARLGTMAASFKARGKSKGKGRSARDSDATAATKPKQKPADHDATASANGGKPKQQTDKDQRTAQRAASSAAQRGWREARAAAARRVLSTGELQSLLGRAAKIGSNTRVQLRHEDKGDGWSVHAEATAGKAHATATATAGHGWIAKDESGQRFYAATNLSAFNRKLIDDTFAELRRDGDGDRKKEGTVRKAYDDKVQQGHAVQRKQQAVLDQRIRGLKLVIDMEAFSGVEKDRKISTQITVTPNRNQRREEILLAVAKFAERFKVVPPKAAPPIKHTPHQRVHLAELRRPPMLGNERLHGYVINMASTPGEVKADMATRYTRRTSGAWEGSAVKALAKLRTAVVTGVNAFLSIDPRKSAQAETKISAAINKVRYPAKSLMAVFGFTWEPSWKKGDAPATLEEVRAAWQALASDAERREALAATEDKVKQQENLPYGSFRNELLNSEHSRRAVEIIGRVNDPVHVLIQDADGGVQGPDMGILAAYDDALRGIAHHPLMVIGGYRFKGFEWGEKAQSRTAQLTELANEIDRAIRVAIGKIAPEMLYPTEPSLLIKAQDQQHKDGVLDKPGLSPNLFGVDSAEGRAARTNVLRANQGSGAHTNPILHAPGASPVTSPAPGRPQRGLEIPEENVGKAKSGDLFREHADDDPDKVAVNMHSHVALELQRQSTLNPWVLNLEFAKATGLNEKVLEKEIFGHVAQTGRTLSDPNVTPEVERERVQLHHGAVDASVSQLKKAKKFEANGEKRAKLEKAQAIVHTIIKAMTGEELKETWAKLKAIFDELDRESNAQQR